MKKAIRIRIYPDEEQTAYINRLLGCCRFLYNKCLEFRMESYETEGKGVSATETLNHITPLKDEFPFLREVHSKVLQQSVRDLNTAYDNFFKHHFGYPKYKSRRDNEQSCRFPKDAFMGVRGNRIDVIKPLKDILFRCSRRDEKYLNKRQDSVQNLTLVKTRANEYYLSVLVDYQPEKKPDTGSVIGIDLGVKDFIVDSNGNRYENQKFYAKDEEKLKRLYRQFSRKEMVPTGEMVFSEKYGKMVEAKKPSHNREKARVRLAKFQESIANRRKQYIQELTSMLVDENQVICIEDLNVKGMLANHKLAKCIQDVSFSEFVRVLEYKCNKYGRTLVRVDRFYPSSKTCSHCGHVNKNLTLSDREWVCPECGALIDRDYNAAVNILNEGLRIIGLSSPEFTPVDCPTMDDRLGNEALKSSGRRKQEKNDIHKFL